MHRFVRDLVAPRAWQPVLPPERDVEPDPVVNPALRAARSWLTRLQERLTKMKYVRGYMNEEINFGGSVGGPGPPGMKAWAGGPPRTGMFGKTSQCWMGLLGCRRTVPDGVLPAACRARGLAHRCHFALSPG